VALKLRLGLSPVRPDAPVAAMADALATALKTPVEIHLAPDYRVLVAELGQRVVDMAWLPPLSLARAVHDGFGELAAVAVRNGTTSFSTALFARKDSGIQDLAGLKDARAAWVDRESAAGYVIIRAALRESGVSLVSAFSQDNFFRSHEAVARAVKDGRCDVGATYANCVRGTTDIDRAGYQEAGMTHDDVRILAYAGPIPSDAIALHKDHVNLYMGPLQQALVDARPPAARDKAKEVMRADGFVRPNVEYRDLLEKMFMVLRGSARPRRQT
jgi:phosphonate transport system substrate-binding protein